MLAAIAAPAPRIGDPPARSAAPAHGAAAGGAAAPASRRGGAAGAAGARRRRAAGRPRRRRRGAAGSGWSTCSRRRTRARPRRPSPGPPGTARTSPRPTRSWSRSQVPSTSVRSRVQGTGRACGRPSVGCADVAHPTLGSTRTLGWVGPPPVRGIPVALVDRYSLRPEGSPMTASGGQDLNSPSTDKIRNVAIVGHSGSGKTTLVEALLLRAGVTGQGRAGRGRHDGLRHRARGGQADDVAVAGPRPVRVDGDRRRDVQGQPDRHARLRRLRRRRRRRPVRRRPRRARRQRRRRRRGRHRGGLGEVRRGRHPAAGVRQQGGQAARRLPPRARRSCRRGSAPASCRSSCRSARRSSSTASPTCSPTRASSTSPTGTTTPSRCPPTSSTRSTACTTSSSRRSSSGDDEQLERYLSGDVPTTAELERTLAHEVLDASSSRCSSARPRPASASTGSPTSSASSARRPPTARRRSPPAATQASRSR